MRSTIHLVKLLAAFCIMSLSFQGCTKKLENNTSPSVTQGQGMFWVRTDIGCGEITVQCNGVSKKITTYNSGGSPACGTNGTATFNLDPGTYTYTASCSGKVWNGTIDIFENNCSKVEIINLSGGSGSGKVVFWVASDLGCGPVTVNCNGQSKTISNFHSTAPACDASGAATFNLPVGNWSYTAFCSGKNWNGTISVSANGCSKQQLTSSSGGGGGGTPPTVTTPETQFMSYQDYSTAVNGYKMEQFTISATTKFVFRFAGQYTAKAVIIPQSSYNNFINGGTYTYYSQFNGTNGTQYVTLAAGTYYVGHRNTSAATNKVSMELDKEITLPASDKATFQGNIIQGANSLAANQKMWHAFTVSSGERYFLDGCNVNMNFYVIPSNQLSAFQSGGTFQHYTAYEGTTGNQPGLFEIKLPPGNYYFVGRATGAAAYTYNMERWKVN